MDHWNCFIFLLNNGVEDFLEKKRSQSTQVETGLYIGCRKCAKIGINLHELSYQGKALQLLVIENDHKKWLFPMTHYPMLTPLLGYRCWWCHLGLCCHCLFRCYHVVTLVVETTGRGMKKWKNYGTRRFYVKYNAICDAKKSVCLRKCPLYSYHFRRGFQKVVWSVKKVFVLRLFTTKYSNNIFLGDFLSCLNHPRRLEIILIWQQTYSTLSQPTKQK